MGVGVGKESKTQPPNETFGGCVLFFDFVNRSLFFFSKAINRERFNSGRLISA